MRDFAKVYSTILDSSVWGESKDVKILWVTLMAMGANTGGVIEASVGGLARRAGLTREECDVALAVLLAPDPDDKSGVDEGRRIHKTERGWRITNHSYYRDFRTDAQVQNAERQQRFRDNRPKGKPAKPDAPSPTVTPVTSNGVTPHNAHQRPDSDREKESDRDLESESTRAHEPAPDLKARSETWLRDPQLATLEHPQPEKWPESERLVAVVAEVFGGKPQPIRNSGDPRMRVLLAHWADGRSTDELEQAVRGAGKDDHLRRNPQFQTLATILKDSNQVDRFIRLLTVEPVALSSGGGGERAADGLGRQLARAAAFRASETEPERKALA